MNDILGMLIPMLMSGAGIGDIIKALGSPGNGAASMDGLTSMMALQAQRARLGSPLIQDQSTIQRAAEKAVSRVLGMNPFTGEGQGAASIVAGLYHVAPDMVGSMLGIPNTQQFFGMIANGAAGINMAAGNGRGDIFNPYSAIGAHSTAMGMAQQVYKLATRPNGGYDISFGHGLNMDEMGKVTQRILSSRIAYEEDGVSIDPKNEADAERFSTHMRKLGSKVNEAVSMLSKVTGSVDEALMVMDRMAGGNFLGGTEKQASDVAARAKKLATAVRVTSAMAGVSSQETYAQIAGLQNLVDAGTGLSPQVALASGLSFATQHIAQAGVLAYNTWAAANPTASQPEKARAQLAAHGRATAFSRENGSRFSAMLAANRGRFSDEQWSRFMSALKEGRANDIMPEVKDVLGGRMVTEMMTNAALGVGVRNRAFQENREALEEADVATMSGNVEQAEAKGTRRLLNRAMSDVSSGMSKAGIRDFTKGVNDSVKDKLVEEATKHGLSENIARKSSATALEKYIKNQAGVDPADFDRRMNQWNIEAARDRINSSEMTESEEMRAKSNADFFLNYQAYSYFSKEKISELREGLSKEGGLAALWKAIDSSPMSAKDKRRFRDDIFSGKITAEEADAEWAKLDDIAKSQSDEYTNEERLSAFKSRVGKDLLAKSQGQLKGFISTKEFQDLSNTEAVRKFSEKVETTGPQLSRDFEEASSRILDSAIGNSLGELNGEDLKKLKLRMAKSMGSKIQGGANVEEAFSEAIKGLSDEDKAAINNQEALDKLVSDAGSSKSNLRKEVLNRDSFYLSLSSVYDSRNTDKLSQIDNLIKGKWGGKFNEQEVLGDLGKLMRSVDGSNMSDKEYDELMSSAEEARANGGWKKGVETLLTRFQPKGKKAVDMYNATAGAKNAENAAVVLSSYQSGQTGDMSAPDFGKETETAVSRADDAEGERVLNRIPNAWDVGSDAFNTDAVASKTLNRMNAIAEKLKGKNINAKMVAASTGDDKNSKIARQKVLKALGGDEGDLAFLQGSTKSNIGGKKAIDVILGGKEAVDNAVKSAGDKSKDQLANVAREAAKKDTSSGYGMMNAIGDLLRKFGPYLKNPSGIPVMVISGGLERMGP